MLKKIGTGIRNAIDKLLFFLIDSIVGLIVVIVSPRPIAFVTTALGIVGALPLLTAKEREFIRSTIGYFKRNEAPMNQIFRTLSPRVKTRIVINYTGNMRIRGPIQRKKLSEKLGIRTPDVLFIDVTSRCNLNCLGCYSKAYRSPGDEMDLETLDRVLEQAKGLGIYTIFLTGGEPLIRSKEVLRLCNKYRGLAFGAFTNGTTIDDKLAKQIEAAANMFFFVSVDGFEKTNDQRRGKGTFQKMLQSMQTLRKHGILFGSSTVVSQANIREVVGDEFVRLMIDNGCAYMSYIVYFPSGNGWAYDSRFLLSADQRAWLHDEVLKLRKKYPISMVNSHLNMMGKCAGGGRLLYVNTQGNVQPCMAVHYACGNVKNQPLQDILASDLPRAYAKREPAGSNPLALCWVLDYPQAVRDIIKESKAMPTHPGAIDLIDQDLPMRIQYAEEWHPVADSIWNQTDPNDFLKRLEDEGVGRGKAS